MLRLAILAATLLAAPLSAQNILFDPLFGDDGVTRATPGESSAAFDLFVRPDDSLLAGGQTGGGAAVFLVGEDGALATTFGTNGVSVLGRSSSSRVTGLEELSDGRILVVGYDFTTTDDEETPQTSFVARLLADGTLDTSFGTNGYATIGTADGLNSLILTTLSLDSGGQIYVFGSAVTAAGRRVISARLTESGDRDGAYGTAGLRTAASAVTVRDAVRLEDGRAVLAGVLSSGMSTGDAALVRLLPNGDVDLTFGQGGTVVTDLGSEVDEFNSVAIDGQGAIVAAGSALSLTTGTSDGVVARYTTAGALDATFGTGGTVVYQASLPTALQSVVIRPDGRILAGGVRVGTETGNIFIAQLLATGQPDGGFSEQGSFVAVRSENQATRDIGLSADGKIVGVGVESLTSGGSTDATALIFRLESYPVASETGPGSLGLALEYRGAHPSRALALAVSLDSQTMVQIHLLDVRGRRIAQLHDGVMGPGAHDLRTAQTLPAGLYFAQATTADGRRVVLPVTIVR